MNELALARLLESFVPQGTGVGTGVLIDREDRQSRQTDVLLFDQGRQPQIMAQTTQVLFPVEVCLASIEVKTTLTRAGVRDCAEKRESLHQLAPTTTDAVGESHPPFVLLAYGAGIGPEQCRDVLLESPDHRPDLLCVLDLGLVGGAPGALDPSQTEWTAGLALHSTSESDNAPEWMAVEPGEGRTEVGGRSVPVVGLGDCYYAADPGRALLIFADALARFVAARAGYPSPVLSAYLTARARAVATL